jgi:hypothetical protein
MRSDIDIAQYLVFVSKPSLFCGSEIWAMGVTVTARDQKMRAHAHTYTRVLRSLWGGTLPDRL